MPRVSWRREIVHAVNIAHPQTINIAALHVLQHRHKVFVGRP